MTNRVALPCQVIQAKSLSTAKNIRSIASKVAIQMSCKAGDAPWVINNSIPYFQKKNFAYCSLASSKGKGGFTISFVGTLNNSASKVYSNYGIRLARKERIEEKLLKDWFVNWIKNYFLSNKHILP